MIEDQRRTDDQWYVLAVDGEQEFQRLRELYGEAVKESRKEASEDSVSKLIAYLYYLGEASVDESLR